MINGLMFILSPVFFLVVITWIVLAALIWTPTIQPVVALFGSMLISTSIILLVKFWLSDECKLSIKKFIEFDKTEEFTYRRFMSACGDILTISVILALVIAVVKIYVTSQEALTILSALVLSFTTLGIAASLVLLLVRCFKGVKDYKAIAIAIITSCMLLLLAIGATKVSLLTAQELYKHYHAKYGAVNATSHN